MIPQNGVKCKNKFPGFAAGSGRCRGDRAVPRRQRGAPAGKRRAHRWQAREDRAVPGDTRRAHFASPRRARRLFCLRADACGDVHAESIVFFACAAGGQEDPRAGPSCQSPGPQGRSRLGNPPSSGSTSLLCGKRCSMGHNAVSFQDYRGQFRVRQPKSQAIRSSPKMQSFSSDFHQQRCSEQVFDPSLTARCARLASTKSKGRTRTAFLLGVERAILIQSHSTW